MASGPARVVRGVAAAVAADPVLVVCAYYVSPDRTDSICGDEYGQTYQNNCSHRRCSLRARSVVFGQRLHRANRDWDQEVLALDASRMMTKTKRNHERSSLMMLMMMGDAEEM